MSKEQIEEGKKPVDVSLVLLALEEKPVEFSEAVSEILDSYMEETIGLVVEGLKARIFKLDETYGKHEHITNTIPDDEPGYAAYNINYPAAIKAKAEARRIDQKNVSRKFRRKLEIEPKQKRHKEEVRSFSHGSNSKGSGRDSGNLNTFYKFRSKPKGPLPK